VHVDLFRGGVSITIKLITFSHVQLKIINGTRDNNDSVGVIVSRKD